MTDTSTVVYTATRGTDMSGLYSSGVGGSYGPTTSGTRIPGVAAAPPPVDAEAPVSSVLADWLASDASRSYENRWIILSASGEVVASGDSPGALPSDAAGKADNMVLFVLPRGVSISG